MSQGRRRRAPGTPDLSAYSQVLSEALAAFGEDSSYAVSMARAANVTASKRSVFKVRNDLEEASAAAKSLCEKADPFKCQVLEPCGTGDCRFAKGEMRLLQIGDSRGLEFRPQLHCMGSYSLENAVKPLKELRMRKDRS